MIPYVAVVATGREGVAVLPASCAAALRVVGTLPGARHEAGHFACATATSDPAVHGICVDDRAVIVGDVRLDGRAELARGLGARPESTDDLGLVLSAYRRWGGATFERLRGDFSVLIWDVAHRTVVAARDGLGIRPCYYAEVSGGLIVSNVLNAVRAYPGVSSRLNGDAVASFLHLGWNANMETTTFAAIRRLAPGHALSLERAGVPARVSRHWAMPDPDPADLAYDEAYLERYRELLGAAVAERIDPRGTLIFLSGGMDSTTIAVSARRALPGARLAALTWQATGLEDATEARLAAEVARRHAIPHTILNEPPIEALAAHPPTPEPVAEAEQTRLADLIAPVARAAGAAVAMEGEDGDALFAPPGIVAMMRRESPMRVAGRLIRHLIRERTRPYAGFWIARRLGLMEHPHREPPPAWLASDSRAAASAVRADDGESTRARPEASASLTRSIWQGVHDTYSRAATGVPLDYRWPLLDTRLIEFVFAIPALPWCQRKTLPRRAFAAELPPSVVGRRKTRLPGYHRAMVRDWQNRQPAEPEPLHPITAEYVDVATLRAALLDPDDPDRVMSAWHALEFDAWVRGAGL